jgi:hypothetical protein
MEWTSTGVSVMPRGIPLVFHVTPAKRRTRVGETISEKNPWLHVFLLLRSFARIPAGAFFFNLL